jgi:hypothetical protein
MFRSLIIGSLVAAFFAGLFPAELLGAGEAVVQQVQQDYFIRFFDAGAFGFGCL